jgi:hypothetical protein
MNPIKGIMNSNNPINQIMQLMNGGMNPQAIANMMMQKNPQAAQLIRQLQQSGKSPKEVVMKMCQDNGIDINQLEEMAKRFK